MQEATVASESSRGKGAVGSAHGVKSSRVRAQPAEGPAGKSGGALAVKGGMVKG